MRICVRLQDVGSERAPGGSTLVASVNTLNWAGLWLVVHHKVKFTYLESLNSNI